MSGLALLYCLSFVPVAGANSQAINTAREAAFIQSGVKQEYDLVKRALEKKVPQPVAAGAFLYRSFKRQEIRFKSSDYGTWTIKKDSVHVTWGISW